MDPDDPEIGAAEANYIAVWRLLGAAFADGAVDETDDYLLTYLPRSAAFFNCVFVKPGADLTMVLDEARAFFEPRKTDFLVRFRDTPASHRVAQSAGLLPGATSPLMNAATIEIDPGVDLDVRAVTEESWDAHVGLIPAGFGMPAALANRVFPARNLEHSDYAAFIAYVDGEPASTAALIVAEGVAGVYNVATPERFRRHGLGEATTRAAVAEGGRRGCALATLQASAMGFPIYDRMGFRVVTRWTSVQP